MLVYVVIILQRSKDRRLHLVFLIFSQRIVKVIHQHNQIAFLNRHHLQPVRCFLVFSLIPLRECCPNWSQFSFNLLTDSIFLPFIAPFLRVHDRPSPKYQKLLLITLSITPSNTLFTLLVVDSCNNRAFFLFSTFAQLF